MKEVFVLTCSYGKPNVKMHNQQHTHDVIYTCSFQYTLPIHDISYVRTAHYSCICIVLHCYEVLHFTKLVFLLSIETVLRFGMLVFNPVVVVDSGRYMYLAFNCLYCYCGNWYLIAER